MQFTLPILGPCAGDFVYMALNLKCIMYVRSNRCVENKFLTSKCKICIKKQCLSGAEFAPIFLKRGASSS